MREKVLRGPHDSPHYGVGSSFVVVERVVVNGMPTAVEIIWEVNERVTAIQQRGLVFELLYPDACRREAQDRLLSALWPGNHSLGASLVGGGRDGEEGIGRGKWREVSHNKGPCPA